MNALILTRSLGVIKWRLCELTALKSLRPTWYLRGSPAVNTL